LPGEKISYTLNIIFYLSNFSGHPPDKKLEMNLHRYYLKGYIPTLGVFLPIYCIFYTCTNVTPVSVILNIQMNSSMFETMPPER
jgi:hypothetical protein